MTQKFIGIIVFISLVIGGSFFASADDNANNTKPNTGDAAPQITTTGSDAGVKPNAPAPGAVTADDLLTNNNLRALSGSTSLWSIASQFEYLGGTINEPLAQDRPDISNASGTTAKADLDGSISVKYNLSATNSLMAGFGIRWIAPLAGNQLTNYTGTTFDAMNPYVQFQHIYKWAGIQSVLQAGVMQWTQADFTAVGYGQQISVDQENMYEIGKTGLSIGVSAVAQYQFFNKSGAYSTPSDPNYVPDVAAVQSVYLLDLAPELEYQLSSKVNLRTLVNLWMFEHYANQSNPGAFMHDTVYQSVGVGISITRDVFLYPNIQFLPQNLQSNLTNLGITATINVF